MVDYTHHTVRLQDGTLFNFKRRFKNHQRTLLSALSQVNDARSRFGKRHPLAAILLILFGGITAGNTTIKDCRLWAVHNNTWFGNYVPLPHGIPDERTLSRAIQNLDMEQFIAAIEQWRYLLYGGCLGSVASFDGKTLRGVHGANAIRHMLSLFTHGLHQIVGQIGVLQKENEIPAFRRLLRHVSVAGMLLIGDALHTQQETVKDILESKANYLLFAKGNQDALVADLRMFFADLPWGSVVEKAQTHDATRERDVTITVTTSHDRQMCDYLGIAWKDITTIGKIERRGRRKTAEGKETTLDETVYCISSRNLSAAEVAFHTRNHWQIENNLHWQKDWTFLEDRQTLRTGTAPQVMSFLRSMCISLFALWNFASVTHTISNFEKNHLLHHAFLRIAGVV